MPATPPEAPDLPSYAPGALAFVGLAKNAGKTTALQFVLESAVRDGRTVGLVSVGRDGEARDGRTGAEKPPLVLPAGGLVVGAGPVLDASSIRLEFLDRLGFSTPSGETVLARAVDPGTVEVTGLRHLEDVERAIGLLHTAGADLVLVDGAYGRRAVAGLSAVDAVVVSTGAVVADDVESVVDATEDTVSRLRIDRASQGTERELLGRSIEEDVCLLVRPDGPERVLGGSSTRRALDPGLPEPLPEESLLAVPGMIGREAAQLLMESAPSGARLLVRSGAVLTMPGGTWRQLREQWQIRAFHSISVSAISCNPTSPRDSGRDLDRRQLLRGVRRRFPDLTVFDAVAARGRRHGRSDARSG
ncbi:MAG: hypothetical protein ABEL76_00995 [Bradymonadaceae bacterium]